MIAFLNFFIENFYTKEGIWQYENQIWIFEI